MLENRSMPRATVIPELPYPDIGEAIGRLCAAFGFTLRLRIGNHRPQLNAGDGAIVLIEGKSPAPASVMVRVEDVDAHYLRTLAAGFRISGEPQTFPYGERQYSALDFAGHRWCFSQSVADSDPVSWGGTPGTL